MQNFLRPHPAATGIRWHSEIETIAKALDRRRRRDSGTYLPPVPPDILS